MAEKAAGWASGWRLAVSSGGGAPLHICEAIDVVPAEGTLQAGIRLQAAARRGSGSSKTCPHMAQGCRWGTAEGPSWAHLKYHIGPHRVAAAQAYLVLAGLQFHFNHGILAADVAGLVSLGQPVAIGRAGAAAPHLGAPRPTR